MDNSRDKFAPLSSREIEDAPNFANSQIDSEWVSPVPESAPSKPVAHKRYGQPSTRWAYRDSNGNLLFEIWRFDTVGERKQFIPLSLWREPDRLHWRFNGVPSPRPLYGLERLASKPNAAVVICEGEKAADAASIIFMNSVCITSPGGSQAAKKADWSVLSGRRILIWPDADEPGNKYAQTVAEILIGLDCKVSLINATTLAGISPDGREREPEQGWDAGDALDEWKDVSFLRKAVMRCSSPFEQGLAYVSFGPFRMTTSGLTHEVVKGKGGNAETSWEWISASFEIIGRARDPSGHGWGRYLRWFDPDGRKHERFVSDASLHSDPAALCAGLAEAGLNIARTQQRVFANYISGSNPPGRVTLVQRTGWHEIDGHLAFVLPNEAIGPKGAGSVVLDSAAHGPYQSKGALRDWQRGVAKLANGHALAILAVSASLAGPLLHLAGQEGGGLNFFGQSSKGKTTLLQIAASVWGRGDSPGYVRAWRATANGLEGAAASSSDTCLVLDEMGMVEGRAAGDSFYSLSNGSGKARAARDGSLREPKSWRVLILSSGEITSASKLSEDRGRKVRAGQLVRMLDVPADRGFGCGAFDNGGVENDPGYLAKEFKQAAISSFGTAGPEFVRLLMTNDVTGEHIRRLVADFVATVVPSGADGQVERAAQRFGLIAAAGELAIVFGLCPWTVGQAREAARWSLGRWIDGRGGTEPAEARQAIEQVRLFIETHGESRFDPLDDSDVRPAINRAGWRKGAGRDREWFIPPETWRVEICQGLDPKFVSRTLAEVGMLNRGADSFQQVKKIGGTSKRVFVINAAIFDGESHES